MMQFGDPTKTYVDGQDISEYVMGTPRFEERPRGQLTLNGYYDAHPQTTTKVDAMIVSPAPGVTPRVAVIMPMIEPASEQRVAYRAEAVAAVMAQTEPVVLIGVYASEESGPAPARNWGLRMARDAGIEWAAFVDDDDLPDKDHVEKLLHRALQTSADVVYPRFRLIGGDYTRRRSLGDLVTVMESVGWRDGLLFCDVLRAGNFIPVTTLVRVEAALAVGGFPEGELAPRHPFPPHPRLEDWGLWLRMLDAGKRFAQLPDVTWSWRQWEGSTSAAYVGRGDVG